MTEFVKRWWVVIVLTAIPIVWFWDSKSKSDAKDAESARARQERTSLRKAFAAKHNAKWINLKGEPIYMRNEFTIDVQHRARSGAIPRVAMFLSRADVFEQDGKLLLSGEFPAGDPNNFWARSSLEAEITPQMLDTLRRSYLNKTNFGSAGAWLIMEIGGSRVELREPTEGGVRTQTKVFYGKLIDVSPLPDQGTDYLFEHLDALITAE